MLVLSVGDSVVAAACVGVPCAWVAVEPDPLIAIDFIHYMSSCFNRDGIPQAAEAAHKQYVWAVTVDHHDDAVLASLQDVVNGCLLPDPAARWTIPRVLDALTSLQRTVASGAGAYSAGTESSGIEVVARSPQVSPELLAPPSPHASSSPAYDVLAIIGAMETLGIDSAIVSSVADAIGTSLTSTLEVLTAKRVPIMKAAALRKTLEARVATPIADAPVLESLPAGQEIVISFWGDDGDGCSLLVVPVVLVIVSVILGAADSEPKDDGVIG